MALGSVGSTSRSKTRGHPHISVSFMMDRDIVLYQKMQKGACAVVVRMDSLDVHRRRFFGNSKTGFLFIIDQLLALSRLMCVFSRCQIC
jgi:hypothetical protein